VAVPALPVVEDIWGRILLHASKDPSVTYAIRRDDGFLDDDIRPAESELSREQTPGRAEALSSAQGRVLDLGCGPGRSLFHLLERGLEVVGIDVSPGAVGIARERGAPDVRVMGIDEVDFPRGSFDTAVFMGSTLALGGGIGIVAQRLARLRPLMRPGGRLITDIREPEATDKPVHRAYHAARKRAGRYPGELRIRLEYQGCASDWFDFTLVNLASLSGAATDTGWQVAHVVPPAENGFAVLARP
jgi:SAM-dependent methyltransferase